MAELEIQPVHESDWDYLIVLDACRYDFFKENYEDFIEGELRPVKSRGTSTPEWLPKTFTSRYNYRYFAANPYVNSLGKAHEDWDPAKAFQRIEDVWATDWNEEENTVLPEDLTDRVIEEDDGSKSIIHYIQPHRPYISCPQEEKVWNLQEQIVEDQETDEPGTKRKMIEMTRPYWSKFFWKIPYRTRWKIKDLMGLENPHWGALVQEVGEEKVREYYEKDLRKAFKEVARLVEELDGKVVVTADHGEALGEQNDWGHQWDSNNPKQYTVPWLEVKGVKD
jgi:hypothetical protein